MIITETCLGTVPKKENKMSDRWVCSDHHFFHENILKFCSKQRPFNSVEEMNEVIIERHNSLVKPNDHVFFSVMLFSVKHQSIFIS